MRFVFVSCVYLLLVALALHYRHVECRPVVQSIDPDKVHTHLMIMFLSYGGDDRRTSLRETWLKDNTNETRWVFILGNIEKSPHKEAILKEQQTFGDIIILNDVKDEYEHLSDKALKGFKAVYERYVFDFLLKTDTDTFVILPRLLEYLETRSHVAQYIGNFGHCQDANELWYGNFKGVYYMLGGGYILTYDLVEYFAHSQHLMKRSRSEDVTVGAHLHSIELTLEALNETLFKASASSACSCVSTLMLNHKCMKTEMYYMYHSFKQTGEICEYKNNQAFADEITKKYNVPVENEKVVLRWA